VPRRNAYALTGAVATGGGTRAVAWYRYSPAGEWTR
jgi:hypothetical protein